LYGCPDDAPGQEVAEMDAPTSRRAFFRVAGRSLAVATATLLLAGCPGGGDDDDDGEDDDD
jgi:hypothetical protein